VQSLVSRKAVGRDHDLIYFSNMVLANFGWGYKLIMKEILSLVGPEWQGRTRRHSCRSRLPAGHFGYCRD
jgi:hypothetical protein